MGPSREPIDPTISAPPAVDAITANQRADCIGRAMIRELHSTNAPSFAEITTAGATLTRMATSRREREEGARARSRDGTDWLVE
ncbi:hypothetical protein DPV78_000970 [Talaromyces pinophilus]|nr:hypothetical protein DPV78_000970 [Talaromyces pinophilus]